MDARQCATLWDDIVQHSRDGLSKHDHDFVDFRQHLYPFQSLLSIIIHMPYRIRKFLLDACRIQQRFSTNKSLQDSLSALAQAGERQFPIPNRVFSRIRHHVRRQQPIITLGFLEEMFDQIYDNPFLLSCLSYFLRAERTAYPSEFHLVAEESLLKSLELLKA